MPPLWQARGIGTMTPERWGTDWIMIISVTELDSVTMWPKLHSEQIWTPHPTPHYFWGVLKTLVYSVQKGHHTLNCALIMRDKTLNISRIVILIHHLSYIVYVSRLWGHPIQSGGHASLCLRSKEKGRIENGSHVSYLNSILYMTHCPPFFSQWQNFLKIIPFQFWKVCLEKMSRFPKSHYNF